MRADLDHQDIADRELGDHAHQRHGDPGRVRVGELGEVADAHQDLDLGQTPAQLVIADDRVREPEMDRVQDRVGEERPAGREQPLAHGDQAVEIAVARGDHHRHRCRLVRQIQRVLASG